MRNLKNKTPKEYWKIINSIDNKKADNNIELDTLYTFFKDLNKQPDIDDDSCDDNTDICIDDNDEILNSPITDSEILKCIKALKNNKACANDDIINEYIKSTSNIMLPLYTFFLIWYLKLALCLKLGLRESSNLFTRKKATPYNQKITAF